ncbi:MAG: ABC transporter permease [Pseudonocardia sp.]|uniref:ABC transporter permease n=1 Tax=unclassified Pseudonocardia TaxID=2619320 RepID=UPI00086934F7|nr:MULTISPECIES: ABC transporter permease [unclassified Pseudonocardia]MBN9112041.1 ABC transporter permease [Pseudonocardia sp.]ODU26193.1 MAG: ABC transporter permease [Pseudonocardia sp. SCN 72-51]ODV06036.1 MAG: ABC transporter permease [Pseudonocardia sp. SCN 73-27]
MTTAAPTGNTVSDPPGHSPKEKAAKQRNPRFDVRERPELLLVPAVFVVLILVWEFVIPLFVDDYVLPVPSRIVDSLGQQLTDPLFWGHLEVTLRESLIGFVIGVGTAILLGTAISQVRLVEKTLMPYVVAFQTVPKVALAPLFVVWFGFGLTSKIVMAAVISFFPMLINVIEGLKAADADRIQMLTVFGASKLQVFRMVRLPSAMPFIFAGLDIGIVFAILGAVVGEFIGAKEGLGYLLLQTNYNFDIAGMFAVLVVLSVLGLLAHFLIRFAQRKIAFWAEESRVIAA